MNASEIVMVASAMFFDASRMVVSIVQDVGVASKYSWRASMRTRIEVASVGRRHVRAIPPRVDEGHQTFYSGFEHPFYDVRFKPSSA